MLANHNLKKKQNYLNLSTKEVKVFDTPKMINKNLHQLQKPKNIKAHIPKIPPKNSPQTRKPKTPKNNLHTPDVTISV